MQQAARFSIAGAGVCCFSLLWRTRLSWKRWAWAVLAWSFAAMAFAQAPPLLNSPYICANGITYTVTVCKPYGTDQWCQWSESQNGRLVTTVNSTWSSMTGRLQGCTNAANSKPANAGLSAPAKASAQPSNSGQQTFNPPYLREFPTVDQIMTQLKGSSAQDTAYRQLTALREFAQMIAALAGPRMAQNQLTPDETRIMTNYFNAYNNLAKMTANPQDAYAGRPDFTAGLFTTFKMPTIQQIWETANTMTASQQAANTPSTQLPPTNDPATLAARRCVELGGTMGQCTISGLGQGLFSLVGLSSDALTKSYVTGLVLFGSYKASSGLLFDFGDSSVNIGGCGTMTQGSHTYTIQPSGSQYAIKIVNTPQPLALILGTDGRIAGPAAQDITGQKIIGYFVETNLKTGASTRTPNYGPVTVHCNVGALQPGPPAVPNLGLADAAGAAIGATTALMSGSAQSNVLQSAAIPPGPRIVGTYASAKGLKIAFDDGAAVVDCAQAHVKVSYDVANSGGMVKITVKNGVSPFNLTLAANGLLTGSGTATVNGKLMTGLNGDTPILTSTSASCPLDTLSPAK